MVSNQVEVELLIGKNFKKNQSKIEKKKKKKSKITITIKKNGKQK